MNDVLIHVNDMLTRGAESTLDQVFDDKYKQKLYPVVKLITQYATEGIDWNLQLIFYCIHVWSSIFNLYESFNPPQSRTHFPPISCAWLISTVQAIVQMFFLVKLVIPWREVSSPRPVASHALTTQCMSISVLHVALHDSVSHRVSSCPSWTSSNLPWTIIERFTLEPPCSAPWTKINSDKKQRKTKKVHALCRL